VKGRGVGKREVEEGRIGMRRRGRGDRKAERGEEGEKGGGRCGKWGGLGRRRGVEGGLEDGQIIVRECAREVTGKGWEAGEGGVGRAT